MYVIETLLKTNNDQINYIYENCISPQIQNNIVVRLSEKN